VTASLNPWFHAYKLAKGKGRTSSTMTTLWKTDSTVILSILEKMNTMLEHLITDDGEEEDQNHKNIRKMIEEPIYTSEEAELNKKNDRKLQQKEVTRNGWDYK